MSKNLLTAEELAAINSGRGDAILEKPVTDDMTPDEQKAAKAYNKARKHAIRHYKMFTSIGEQQANTAAAIRQDIADGKIASEDLEKAERKAARREQLVRMQSDYQAEQTVKTSLRPFNADAAGVQIKDGIVHHGRDKWSPADVELDYVEGGQSSRLTATRIVALGVFALAFKKDKTARFIAIIPTVGAPQQVPVSKRDAAAARELVMKFDSLKRQTTA